MTRGKFVRQRLFCQDPPPPPPNVPELVEGEKAALTGSLRQRMEQHRANPSCAVCHRMMDPLGFSLENFDGLGRWRETTGPGSGPIMRIARKISRMPNPLTAPRNAGCSKMRISDGK